jgi:hypothetical protein
LYYLFVVLWCGKESDFDFAVGAFVRSGLIGGRRQRRPKEEEVDEEETELRKESKHTHTHGDGTIFCVLVGWLACFWLVDVSCVLENNHGVMLAG